MAINIGRAFSLSIYRTYRCTLPAHLHMYVAARIRKLQVAVHADTHTAVSFTGWVHAPRPTGWEGDEIEGGGEGLSVSRIPLIAPSSLILFAQPPLLGRLRAMMSVGGRGWIFFVSLCRVERIN